jgi:hypothetical protein
MRIHKKEFTFIPTGEKMRSLEFDTEKECMEYDRKIGNKRKSIYMSDGKYYISELIEEA